MLLKHRYHFLILILCIWKANGQYFCYNKFSEETFACYEPFEDTVLTINECCIENQGAGYAPKFPLKHKDGYFCQRCSKPVNGGWGEWSEWSVCKGKCGSGMRTRKRDCNNPPPAFGGEPCSVSVLDSIEIEDCSLKACVVNGEWGEWSEWSHCIGKCDVGLRTRRRECNNPPPSPDGLDCSNEIDTHFQQEICNLLPCKVDGGWSAWGPFSECSVSCGEGLHYRRRMCNKPKAQNGGKDCPGSKEEYISCFERNCPIDGEWSEWSEWGPCSVTCGEGIRRRARECDNPIPQHGGAKCPGEGLETDVCKAAVKCTIDGQWSSWSGWQVCYSTDCRSKGDLGIRYRQRACSGPKPSNGGRMCQGASMDMGVCLDPVNCPVDGKWGKWSSWTCTAEFAKRSRKCNDPSPKHGGKDCQGEGTEFFTKQDNPNSFDEICEEIAPNDENEFENSGDGNDQEEDE